MTLYLPFNGRVNLTSRYGYRVLYGQQEWHPGLDLVGLDDTTIIAPCDGVIKSSAIYYEPLYQGDRTYEWGNYIRLDTNDGYQIYMCHMAQRFVTVGQIVKRGQPLGIMGSTGRSTAPHTHFEVRKNGQTLNPCQFLEIPNEGGIYKNIEPKKEEEEEMTQEQFNKMLKQAFIDLAKEQPTSGWGADAIAWGLKNGIIKGDNKGNTMPKKPMNREEVLTVLKRLYEKK